jgi:hypothetical protein
MERSIKIQPSSAMTIDSESGVKSSSNTIGKQNVIPVVLDLEPGMKKMDHL